MVAPVCFKSNQITHTLHSILFVCVCDCKYENDLFSFHLACYTTSKYAGKTSKK